MTVPGSLYTPTIRKTRGVSLVEIENSALFDSANSESLTRSPGVAGDRRKFTIRAMIYRAKLGIDTVIISADTNDAMLDFTTDDTLRFWEYTSSFDYQLYTTQKFRDIGWYDIVIQFDSTQGTAADRMTMEVNGIEVTSFGTRTDPSLNFQTRFNNTVAHSIGQSGSSTNYGDYYLAEMCLIDGTAYSATSFGEFDETGLYWTPKSSTNIKALTFGTNGFYLDNTTNAQTDASGNGNNFTNNNTVLTSTHTPTNQACLMNPLYPEAGTLERGNRTGVTDGVDGAAPVGTLFFDAEDTDGYYFEGKPTTGGTIGAFLPVGICTAGHVADHPTNDAADARSFFFTGNGGIQNTSYISNGTWDAYANGTGAINDIYMFAVKGGNLYFGINNYWYDSSDGTFANAGAAFTGVTGFYTPCFQLAAAATGKVEFSFLDADFTYSRPSTTKEITTTNIAEATTRTVSDPYEHWSNTLYTGTGASLATTGVGFQPDFAWIKGRSGATEHVLTDIVRGVTKELSSNDNGAEETVAQGLTAFGSDGFTVGTDASYNTSSATYIAWLAKLGGAAVSNEDGSITTSVSVNTTLGMAAFTYTGNGSSGATLGTGVTIPSGVNCWAYFKKYNTGNDWHAASEVDGTIYGMELNNTTAHSGVSNGVTDFHSDSGTTITITAGGVINDNTATYVCYLWWASEFINIGSFEGTGNTDGTFVPFLNSAGVPLMPIWSTFKDIDAAANWEIMDVARSTYNPVGVELFPNTSGAESTSGAPFPDFVSGGMKARGAGDPNTARTYINLTIGIPTIDVDGRLLTAR